METLELCPAQQKALEHLRYILPIGNVFAFYGDSGQGKTTILRHLHEEIGGAFLTVGDFLKGMEGQHPFAPLLVQHGHGNGGSKRDERR